MLKRPGTEIPEKPRQPAKRGVRFEDWPKEREKILREIEESERITQADLNIVINT